METKIKFVVVLMSMAVLAMVAGNAFALSGACVNCHTMHNSQDGSIMAYDGAAASGMLLRAGTCAGCHADASILTGDGIPGTLIDTIPQIDKQTNYLAGGSFYWVKTDEADAKGHNVSDLAIAADGVLTVPPGFDAAMIPTGLSTVWTGVDDNNVPIQLTCSGVYGCHGDHTQADKFAAVKGAHHDNAAGDLITTEPTSVGTSYRFLNGIKGGEAADYELNPTATSHNVYYGTARTGVTTNPTDTISALCAQCHGKFHTAADIASTTMSSPWLRHPSDIDMRDVGGEYEHYVYNVQAPVALSAMPASLSNDSYANEAIVTCISCHRAHGSEYDDLLRWAYNEEGGPATVAGADAANGGGQGCFRCHTTKDGI